MDQEENGLAAPTGPPPIPTESTVYSYSSGYRGWTPALAQANVNAIAALSAKLWAQIGPPTPANIAIFETQIGTQLQSPNPASLGNGSSVNGMDPALTIYSDYYSDDYNGDVE
jgi:hypothetical protein